LYTYLFQFGFLRKREDGSTSMTLLNPDNDGISKEPNHELKQNPE
jgi:hypothetical protein